MHPYKCKLRFVIVGKVMLRYGTSTAPSSMLRHCLYPQKRHTSSPLLSRPYTQHPLPTLPPSQQTPTIYMICAPTTNSSLVVSALTRMTFHVHLWCHSHHKRINLGTTANYSKRIPNFRFVNIPWIPCTANVATLLTCVKGLG